MMNAHSPGKRLRDFLQTLALRRSGFVWGVLCAAVVAALAVFFWPGLHPCLWEDYAVAAGLRPPTEALSGHWRGLFSVLFALLPAAAAEWTLRGLGLVAGGALTALAIGFFRDLIPTKLRAQVRALPYGHCLECGVIGLGALTFVCTQSVWKACQAPGITLCEVFVALLAMRLVAGAFRKGSFYRLYVPAFLFGTLVGDGLFGAAAFVFVGIVLFLWSRWKIGSVTGTLANAVVRRAVTVRMLLAFAVAAVTATTVNFLLYLHWDGVLQSDYAIGNVMLLIVGGWIDSLGDVTSALGAVMALFSTVGSLVLLAAMFARLSSDKPFCKPVVVAVLLFAVLLGWSQNCGFCGLWARRLVSSFAIRSDFAEAILALLGALSVVWGLLLLRVQFSQLVSPLGRKAVATVFFVLVAAILAGGLPTCVRRPLRQMMAVVDAYCREVAAECSDDARLLTDGRSDAGVELAAFREGRRLVTVSMMSGDGPHDVRLRQRGVEDGEDLKALESGAADAFRYWMDARTNRLEGLAAQLGFDRRQEFAPEVRPRVSGLVAHFGGTPDAREKNETEAARALGRRLLDVAAQVAVDREPDADVRRQFRTVQWRLAELCRSRLRLATAEAAREEILADNELATALDRANPMRNELRRLVGWRAEHHGAVLLPREGVRIGISRSDFKMAHHFAEDVLKSNPNDPEANFATGMYHFLNRQYARARPYLQRVVEVQSENPAVLSNLAVVESRLGNLKEALEYGERAMRAAPNDQKIRSNVERIRKRIRESLAPGAK